MAEAEVFRRCIAACSPFFDVSAWPAGATLLSTSRQFALFLAMVMAVIKVCLNFI